MKEKSSFGMLQGIMRLLYVFAMLIMFSLKFFYMRLISKDGIMELLVGSEDYKIRAF